MGLFKNLREVQKAGAEIHANFDLNAQLRDANTVMAQASQLMEQQTMAARLSMEGAPARVSITTVRDTGKRMDVDPVLELSLLVTAEGGLPVPVTVEQTIAVMFLARVVPGASFPARVDPADINQIWINWQGA